jgi:hypothetical protein
MELLKQIPTEQLELLIRQKKNNFRKNTNNGVVTLDETSEFELYGKLIRETYNNIGELITIRKHQTLGDLLDYLLQEELLKRKNDVQKSAY